MNKLKIYAAPMEGLTGFAWRKAQSQIFGGVDKYYTPFVVANQTHKFKTKEIRDLTQDEENLVPQVMTDKAEHFIWAARELKAMGYDEVNLNLGCPSGTVVTKGKGAGALRDVKGLDMLLDQIFSASPDVKVSVKTRIGYEAASEWQGILEVYSKYPISELIVHPRLRSEFYEGLADRGAYEAALDATLDATNLKLVYNGDIVRADDEAFAKTWDVMIGRGLIGNPSLGRQIRGGAAASPEELREFHDLLLEYYCSYMPGDGPAIHHMKAMWVYFQQMFDYDERDMKKLRKARKLSEYKMAARVVMAGE